MERTLRSVPSLKAFLKKQKPSSVSLITSRPLEKRFGWVIREMGLGKDNVIHIPDGEGAKQWKALEQLLIALRTRGADRHSVLIALGGGTIGDVAGFAAAIYLRGIRYIQVPTTLLAQVDSAHGGKTGINFGGHKNQIGSIYEPVAIVLEPRFLKSLGRQRVVDGLGEILKAGFIKDPSILTLLEREKVSTLMKSRRLPTIIEKAIRVKHWYVSEDPQEKNSRAMLNFGHTIGHAIELSHHLSHGSAVISGMREELRITEAMGYTSPSVLRRLEQLLKSLGIIAASVKPDRKTLRADKKLAGKTLSLPVVRRAGRSEVIRIPLDRFIKYT